MPLTYWTGSIAIFFVGTLLSGLYPAFVLSGYRPIAVLKGAFKNREGSQILRKGLIVTQFAASVAMIAGTILVYSQVDFMRSQKLGVNIDRTVVMEGAASPQDSVYQSSYLPFKTEVKSLSGVQSLTASSNIPGKEIYWTNSAQRVGVTSAPTITLFILGIDYDFIPSFDVKIDAGRNFSEQYPSDNKACVLNQVAVKELGFENASAALGGKVWRGRDTLTVIGVVADYHQEGLQKAIVPTILLLQSNTRSYYSVKLLSSDLQGTIAKLQHIWDKQFPNDPFNFFFLDDTFDQQYRADVQFGRIFGIFSGLAIVIACSGLLGMSSYNSLQRAKEIGIRKVLGASAQNLVLLLTKDFVILVLAGFALAVPVAWLVMRLWLQNFAYRANIDAGIFIVAGLSAAVVALLTVGVQAVKAATGNPVEALRNE